MPHFQTFRGDTIELSFSVKNDDGSARNISTDTITATLKSAVSDTDAAALSQVSAVVVSASAGTGTVTFPASATDDLTANTTLVYDIQLVTSADVVKTIDTGTIAVRLDVTRTVA